MSRTEAIVIGVIIAVIAALIAAVWYYRKHKAQEQLIRDVERRINEGLATQAEIAAYQDYMSDSAFEIGGSLVTGLACGLGAGLVTAAVTKWTAPAVGIGILAAVGGTFLSYQYFFKDDIKELQAAYNVGQGAAATGAPPSATVTPPMAVGSKKAIAPDTSMDRYDKRRMRVNATR